MSDDSAQGGTTKPPQDHRVFFACECCTTGDPEGAVHSREDLVVMPDGTWLCHTCYDDCDKTAHGMVASDVDDFEFPRPDNMPCPPVHAPVAALAERMQASADHVVRITYTNYRGETSERTIIPKSLRFGSTEWHPEPQWLLLAFDAGKNADREFALKDFGSRSPAATATEPHAIKCHSSGGSTGVHDYLMSDGSIKAMTPAEARASLPERDRGCLSQPETDVKDLAITTARHGLAELFVENERLRAQVEQTREILSAIDLSWLETFDRGPDADYGGISLGDEHKKFWRDAIAFLEASGGRPAPPPRMTEAELMDALDLAYPPLPSTDSQKG